MPLGSFPAGFGPAGIDPAASSAAAAALPTGAPALDGLTRDFIQDATTGDFARQHPIDAKFFNLMRIVVGSVRSALAVGQGIGNLKWIDPRTINAFVTDQVTQAAAQMLEAGEIAIHQVIIDSAVRGRVAFQVDYTNLQTGQRQTLKP